jgi:hypothetical protein
MSKEIVLRYIPQLSDENLQNKEEDVNNYTLNQAVLATLRLVQPQGSLNIQDLILYALVSKASIMLTVLSHYKSIFRMKLAI